MYIGLRKCLIVVSLVGCSSSSDNEPVANPVTDLSFEDLLAGARNALCAWHVRCGLLPDAESCVEVGLFDWGFGAYERDVGAGIVKYDPTVARQCLEYLEGDEYQSCDTFDDLGGWDATCGRALSGTLSVGQACSYSEQCAESAACDISSCDEDSTCCAGTCAVPGGVGTACSSSRACLQDYYCDSDEATCQPRAAMGDACDSETACPRDAYCLDEDLTDGTDAGVCAAFSGVGEPCEPESSFCADWDSWCHPGTHTCARLADIGELCAGSEGCRLDAYCDGASCQPLGRVGEPCGDYGCLMYLACSEGVCSTTPPPSCTSP